MKNRVESKFGSKGFWIVASALCIVLLVLQYGSTHIDEIFAAKGDYYFAKNDMPNAEKYYESAFELGVNDSKRRNNYINIMINSPLTIASQEKIVKFINYPTDDAARLKAEYFLYDLRREISKKYEGNYIRKAVYNGKIMRWDKFPVTYGFSSQEEIPEYYITEAEKAFAEWEKALNHKIYFEKTSKNPNILINYKIANYTTDENKKYIVAVTTPQITPDEKLTRMKIDFNIKGIDDQYFSPNQVYNTSLHEIAHALGVMGHSENKKDVMFMSKDSKSLDNDEREELTNADINTVKLLYSTKPDITNYYGTQSSYVPYIVLGDSKDVTNSKIREAKFYIKKAPHLPMGYIDLAIGYSSAKDYEKAVKALNKALQVADSNEVLEIIYYNLAASYFYMDDYKKSAEYLTKSIQLKDTEEKRYLLAEIYQKEKKLDLAIGEYEKLISEHPHNIEYTIALTNIYVQNKNYINARKVLKAYYAANPKEKQNPRLAPYGIIRFGL